MSLTVFAHSQNQSVAIIRWFLEPKGLLSYASGPVIEMGWSEFRSGGHDFVLQHFTEFTHVRICEQHLVAPFERKQGKRFMEDRDVIEIKSQPGIDFEFLPCVVRQYNLGRGIEVLEKEKRRVIPYNSSPDLFWKTFDEVLAFSREYFV